MSADGAVLVLRDDMDRAAAKALAGLLFGPGPAQASTEESAARDGRARDPGATA